MDVIHRIINDGTGSSILDFGDSANAQIGRLKYNHATDTFSIYVNAAERFTVNSSGNITVAGTGTITVNGVIVGSAANKISGLATIANSTGIFSTNSSGTITVPSVTDTLVGKATSDTLTNKTLTLPVIASIVNTGTLTLPTATDTLVARATSDTLTNKIMSGASNTFSNIGDGSLSVSYIKADGSRALTANWAAGAFSGTFNSVIVGSALNTISGLASIINTGTLTLPTATDTLVARATSDTLTNKIMSGASNTFSNIGDGSLSVSYLKADGTRPLTGNWNAGAFSGTFNGVSIGSSANTISGASNITGLTTIAWTIQNLTDGATINWNMALGGTANLAINGARTMAAPTNLQTGMTYILKVTQGTASSTITWNSVFKWPAGAAPVLSTTVGAIDLISFYYDGSILMGSYLRGMA